MARATYVTKGSLYDSAKNKSDCVRMIADALAEQGIEPKPANVKEIFFRTKFASDSAKTDESSIHAALARWRMGRIQEALSGRDAGSTVVTGTNGHPPAGDTRKILNAVVEVISLSNRIGLKALSDIVDLLKAREAIAASKEGKQP